MIIERIFMKLYDFFLFLDRVKDYSLLLVIMNWSRILLFVIAFSFCYSNISFMGFFLALFWFEEKQFWLLLWFDAPRFFVLKGHNKMAKSKKNEILEKNIKKMLQATAKHWLEKVSFLRKLLLSIVKTVPATQNWKPFSVFRQCSENR